MRRARVLPIEPQGELSGSIKFVTRCHTTSGVANVRAAPATQKAMCGDVTGWCFISTRLDRGRTGIMHICLSRQARDRASACVRSSYLGNYSSLVRERK